MTPACGGAGLSDDRAIKDIDTADGIVLPLRQKLDGNEEPAACG
jgi:hypothetical protein